MDRARLAGFEQLRQRRRRAEPDRSLAFLAEAFQRDVARPHRQLGGLATLWAELVPAPLAAHTRLESLKRGTLTVAVHSSAHHYELDRLLREGLQRELVVRHRGPAFRRVKLHIAPILPPPPDRPPPQ